MLLIQNGNDWFMKSSLSFQEENPGDQHLVLLPVHMTAFIVGSFVCVNFKKSVLDE